jgi:tRNA(Arg) A34 adenosine deaminase TadA
VTSEHSLRNEFMREAIRLSVEKMESGAGGPFGAVVACGDRIVGRGWNQVTSLNDPTAHAEIVAIREACRRLKSFKLEHCELFTSCEPCPMCLAAIYWARIPRVFYGNTRRDAARIQFDDEWIYEEVAAPIRTRKLAMRPLLRSEALAAFRAWRDKTDKIPY